MFADRSVLEKVFPSSSVIKPVYAFVRSCLREDAKVHKFVLCMLTCRIAMLDLTVVKSRRHLAET